MTNREIILLAWPLIVPLVVVFGGLALAERLKRIIGAVWFGSKKGGRRGRC